LQQKEESRTKMRFFNGIIENKWFLMMEGGKEKPQIQCLLFD
jgi:hypothetical protein